MASNLFWFYDALIIGIALIFLYAGGKRGLMKSVVLIVLTVVSFALSWFISEVGAPVIYDSLLQKPILSALGDSSEKTDPVSVVNHAVSNGNYGVEMTDIEIEGIISQTGDFFANIAGEIKNNGANEGEAQIAEGMESTVTEIMLNALVGDVVSPSVLTEILESVSGTERNIRAAVDVFLNGDRAATASMVEENVVAPAVKTVLRWIIWIVSMFILMFVSRAIANAFKGLNRVPIIGPVNVLLGAVLGLAEGAVIIYLIAQLVKLVCYFTDNSLMFLNCETVESTYLFKYLFNFDAMKLIGG